MSGPTTQYAPLDSRPPSMTAPRCEAAAPVCLEANSPASLTLQHATQSLSASGAAESLQRTAHAGQEEIVAPGPMTAAFFSLLFWLMALARFLRRGLPSFFRRFPLAQPLAISATLLPTRLLPSLAPSITASGAPQRPPSSSPRASAAAVTPPSAERPKPTPATLEKALSPASAARGSLNSRVS